MLALLVVADDMTGAIDTGVQFSRDGFRIYVTSIENMTEAPTGHLDILVVNTESRHLSPEAATDRVEEVIANVPRGGARVLYKKVDSTLRGNIGAELEGMLRASHRKSVAYLPAYPDTGRTTSGGELLVNYVPVGDTEFARDPLNPVRTSSIPALLAEQTRLPAVVVANDATPALPLPDGTIVVFDSSENADLERFAMLLRGESDRLVFAGCGGFAAFLDRIVTPSPVPTLPSRGIASSRRLVVCGSLNPRSLAQLERAAAAGIPVYSLSSLAGITPSTGGAGHSRPASTVLDEVREGVNERGIVAVRTPPPTTGEGSDGLSVARRMARVVAELMRSIGFDALIVFGGDTLTAIMRALGVVGLVPIGEVEHGVPVSVSVTNAHSAFLDKTGMSGESPPHERGTAQIIVSKAGGFGGEDVVAAIENYLNRLENALPGSLHSHD